MREALGLVVLDYTGDASCDVSLKFHRHLVGRDLEEAHHRFSRLESCNGTWVDDIHGFLFHSDQEMMEASAISKPNELCTVVSIRLAWHIVFFLLTSVAKASSWVS